MDTLVKIGIISGILFSILLIFGIAINVKEMTTGPALFEDGEIVHHILDNKKGFILYCENTWCRVRVDSAKDYVVWSVDEMKEYKEVK